VMGRRHHLDAVGAVLIGEMGIEAEAGIVPIAGIDLAGGRSSLAQPTVSSMTVKASRSLFRAVPSASIVSWNRCMRRATLLVPAT
jgi:hypothetical protein